MDVFVQVVERHVYIHMLKGECRDGREEEENRNEREGSEKGMRGEGKQEKLQEGWYRRGI